MLDRNVRIAIPPRHGQRLGCNPACRTRCNVRMKHRLRPMVRIMYYSLFIYLKL